MIELLQAAFALPTLVFTILLGIVVAYWALVIVGALDLDILDGADGATDAIDTASDAFTTAEVDGADGFLGGTLPALLTELGLRGVPLTAWLSIFVLIAWATTLLGMRFVGGAATQLLGSFGGSAVITTAALAVAAAGTAAITRPMRRLFVGPTARSHKSLVGKVCTVTTMRVDGGFGQAEVEDGGAGLLLQVRCDESNDLTRGSQALIFDYDPVEGIFHVSRFDDPVDTDFAARRLRTPN